MSEWRQGRHVSIHVYEDDRPVATFVNAADAERVVACVNSMGSVGTVELTDLIDQSRIAVRLGLTKTAVNNWSVRFTKFPAPLIRLGNTPVYSWRAVRDWYIKQFGMSRYREMARDDEMDHAFQAPQASA